MKGIYENKDKIKKDCYYGIEFEGNDLIINLVDSNGNYLKNLIRINEYGLIRASYAKPGLDEYECDLPFDEQGRLKLISWEAL